MATRNPNRTPLDLRVASGLKVMAIGSEALAWTPARIRDAAYVARLKCSCGHSAFIGHYPLIEAGRGDVPMSDLIGKRPCGQCGKQGALEIVDPMRDNLE